MPAMFVVSVKPVLSEKSALEAAIERYFAGRMRVHPTDSGVHIVCWLADGLKAKRSSLRRARSA